MNASKLTDYKFSYKRLDCWDHVPLTSDTLFNELHKAAIASIRHTYYHLREYNAI